MDTKRATIRDIAKVAGVSPSTVFRALKSDVPVSAATRAKILAAQQLLQNQVAESASAAAPVRSVGIIMPAVSASDLSAHPSMFTIITSFLEALSAHNISNTMLVFDETNMTASAFLAAPKDAYLLIGTSEGQERTLLEAFSAAQIPCVLINRQSELPHVSSVAWDDTSACTDATERLIALGHQNIVFIGGNKDFQNTRRRLLGFEMAMKKHNLPIGSDNVMFGEYSELSGYQIGAKIAARKDRPTAGLFASDPLAIGCMRRLVEAGLHLPDDFSMIGFGDIEACHCISPSLSTIAQPSRECGVLAAQVLLQMLQMPVISSKLLLKTNLILRDSVCPPVAERSGV